jgi:polyribonucleotide nucleotidyltransferase
VEKYATADMLEAIQIKEKLSKYARIDEIKADVKAHFTEVYANSLDLNTILTQVKKITEEIEAHEVRS